MILVLDIGNSQIFGGVFDDERLVPAIPPRHARGEHVR